MEHYVYYPIQDFLRDYEREELDIELKELTLEEENLYLDLYNFNCPLDEYREYSKNQFNELSSKIRKTIKINMDFADKLSFIIANYVRRLYRNRFKFRILQTPENLENIVNIKELPFEIREDDLYQIWRNGKPHLVIFYHRKQLGIEKQISLDAKYDQFLDLPILFIEFLWKMGLTYKAARKLYNCSRIIENRIKL